MGIATRTYPPDINPPITAASLIAGLRDGLIAAGFPQPLKNYVVNTDQYVIWELNFDSTKAYGKCYYRLKVTSTLSCTHAVGATWTDSTNTLGQVTAELQPLSYVSNIVVKGWGFKSEELTLLSVVQGANTQLLGFFRFAEAPAFDESSFPKIFIPSTNDVNTLYCTGVTPYSSSSFVTSLLNPYMSTADTYFQQRSQTTGFFLYGPSNTGIIARSSDDLAMGSCSGMTRGDVFQVPDSNPLEQYILLKPAAGALLIRI